MSPLLAAALPRALPTKLRTRAVGSSGGRRGAGWKPSVRAGPRVCEGAPGDLQGGKVSGKEAVWRGLGLGGSGLKGAQQQAWS